MRGSRDVRTLSTALVVVVTLLLTSSPGSAAADPPGQPPNQAADQTTDQVPPAPAAGTTSSYQVTLVTGDRVRLDVAGDGTHRATLVDRAGGSDFYQSFTDQGDAYVVPGTALPMLAADRLDLALFNVSGLVEQGFDDDRSPALPLLLTHDDPAAAAAPLGTGPALAGTPGARALPSVNGLAVAADRSHAEAFWESVAGSGRSAAEPSTLAAGIGKIWLDARVTVAIDQSVPLVGAPAAWQRGYDGSGVTVAVLDTGVDPTHPDLRDQVAGSRDFTGKGNAVDGYGHGTHVSSILAGTGAASDGRYRGVAPGADLLVGKVLDDGGSGQMSWVIAGMEWAASSGADVVNLSLGGPVTGGDDPASRAVDALTEQHGTLFVVAAGNRGPHDSLTHNVTSPAVASAALAVGASRDGFPASFSRDGVMGRSTVKPEIVAPGWNITAARAAGTCCGDSPYASNAGTSMAAPHVAGAAAILAQQHPDWHPAQLKAALVSTADPLEFGLPYRQGSGQLNVDRATAQQVRVDAGVLDLGYLTRPFEPGELTPSRTLNYTNNGGAPVTLDLTTTLQSEFGDPGPKGALSVQPEQLTLAPGATGSVRVELDATELAGGTYGGWVTARYGDRQQLVTGYGFYKEDDTVEVTFRMVDRNGEPGFGSLRVSQYRDFNPGAHYPQLLFFSPQQTEWTLRLPENDYNVFGVVATADESGRFIEEYSVVGDPELEVPGPPGFTVTLDARTANPLRAQTPRPSEPRSTAITWSRGADRRNGFRVEPLLYFVFDGGRERLSIAPVEPVREQPFEVLTTFDSAVPLVEASVDGRPGHGHRDPVPLVYSGGPLADGVRELPLVDAGTAAPEELAGRDLTGAAALVQEAADRSWVQQVIDVTEAGAAAIVLYSARPGVLWPDLRGAPISTFTLSRDEGERLRDRAAGGPATLRLVERPVSPYRYTLTRAHHQQIPSDVEYRPAGTDLAEIRHRVHGAGAEPGRWLRQTWSGSCDCGTWPTDDAAAVGRVHTEYVTADPDLSVERGLQLQQLGSLARYQAPALVSYRPGEQVTEDWLAAPLAPGVFGGEDGGAWRSVRYRELISYSLPTLVDTAGHGATVSRFGSLESTSRLYRDGDGTPLQESDVLSGRVPVPVEPGDYRLEVDTDHDGSELDLSTRTRTVWRFHSGPPADDGDPEVLALLDVDYTGLTRGVFGAAPALDLANRAGHSQVVSLGLRVGHQSGADAPPPGRPVVWVSFDDGQRWRQVPVLQDPDGQLRAVYRHPPRAQTSGYVSLRVQVGDSAGNTLEQTVIRGYGLR